MPRVNFVLLVGVLLLVAMFRSSSALASAYGIAVTGTMVVTGIMAFVVIWKVWRWPLPAAAALMVPFLFIDLSFLGANLLKVVEGGWVPLALGGLVIIVMYTWRHGSRLLFEKTRRQEIPLADLVRMLEKKPPLRVPGTAVFLTSTPECAPTALMHSLKHYKVLHEHNVILTIETADAPRVDPGERVRIEGVGETFTRVRLRFRIHGDPERTEGAGDRAQDRLDVRHHVHIVLSVTTRAQAGHSLRHAALAGSPFHHAHTDRQRRHRLLPDPDRASRGGGHAGDDLIASPGNKIGEHTLDSRAVTRDFWRPVPAPRRNRGGSPMSAQLGRENVHDLAPEEVARGLAEGKILLVDVREPNETEIERYPDAFYLPMSEFDPAAIPDPQGRQVVFACRSGNRSVTASLIAQSAGLPYDSHLAGGMKAWKELGLPTES